MPSPHSPSYHPLLSTASTSETHPQPMPRPSTSREVRDIHPRVERNMAPPRHHWTDFQISHLLNLITSSSTRQNIFFPPPGYRSTETRYIQERSLCLQVLRDTGWMDWLISHGWVLRGRGRRGEGVLEGTGRWAGHSTPVASVLDKLNVQFPSLEMQIGKWDSAEAIPLGTSNHAVWDDWQKRRKRTLYFVYRKLRYRHDQPRAQETSENESFHTSSPQTFYSATGSPMRGLTLDGEDSEDQIIDLTMIESDEDDQTGRGQTVSFPIDVPLTHRDLNDSSSHAGPSRPTRQAEERKRRHSAESRTDSAPIQPRRVSTKRLKLSARRSTVPSSHTPITIESSSDHCRAALNQSSSDERLSDSESENSVLGSSLSSIRVIGSPTPEPPVMNRRDSILRQRQEEAGLLCAPNRKSVDVEDESSESEEGSDHSAPASPTFPQRQSRSPSYILSVRLTPPRREYGFPVDDAVLRPTPPTRELQSSIDDTPLRSAPPCRHSDLPVEIAPLQPITPRQTSTSPIRRPPTPSPPPGGFRDLLPSIDDFLIIEETSHRSSSRLSTASSPVIQSPILGLTTSSPAQDFRQPLIGAVREWSPGTEASMTDAQSMRSRSSFSDIREGMDWVDDDAVIPTFEVDIMASSNSSNVSVPLPPQAVQQDTNTELARILIGPSRPPLAERFSGQNTRVVTPSLAERLAEPTVLLDGKVEEVSESVPLHKRIAFGAGAQLTPLALSPSTLLGRLKPSRGPRIPISIPAVPSGKRILSPNTGTGLLHRLVDPNKPTVSLLDRLTTFAVIPEVKGKCAEPTSLLSRLAGPSDTGAPSSGEDDEDETTPSKRNVVIGDYT